MFYVVRDNNGVVGYTDNFDTVKAMLNDPLAKVMGYTYEERTSRPIYLDRLA